MINRLLGNWFEQPLVVIDVETTGFSPEYDRVVEVAAVRVERGRVLDGWSTLIDPCRLIPRSAQKAHGISDHDVYMKPRFLHVASKLISLTRGAFPVAYSSEFDRRMLAGEMDRAGLGHVRGYTHLTFDPQWPWIDPLIWVRDFDGQPADRQRNTLTAACTRRGIELKNAHRALDDAEATAILTLELSRRIGHMTVTQLLLLQRDGARRWADQKKKASGS
jgi:DNA polymerase III epsilon subunit-like protein